MMRNDTLVDRLIYGFDQALHMVQRSSQSSARVSPAEGIAEQTLSKKEQQHSAGLLRVDHTGEVCAQALYQGQSLTTSNQKLQQQLQQAAAEENDHLAWCAARLQELHGHPSYLNPLWYSGALLLGMCAGALGDRWNLGFLAETEKQVTRHLENHLRLLPEADEKSRCLLTQMREDEMAHATFAVQQGGVDLPPPIPFLMRSVAKIMTTIAYWL